MNYWLHRISHEWNTSSYFLDKGYLTIGWSCLSHSGIEKKIQTESSVEIFEHIMQENDLTQFRSRWNLWNFCSFKENDIVVVPLYNGEFSVYRIIGSVYPITLISDVLQNEDTPFRINDQKLLLDSDTREIIDLGFFIPIEPIKLNLSRYEYADAPLTSRMKMRQTNGNITDLAESVQNAISAETPINLYATVIGDLAKKLLDAIKAQLNPDKFEKLIKWYFQKIGASNSYIDAKNKSGKTDGADADIIAEFDLLKVTFYIQAKFYTDKTSEWAVQQISRYKEQFDSHFGEYTVMPWVISTADSFSSEALELAEKENIRLIAGEEFARMLIDAGITDINKAFE